MPLLARYHAGSLFFEAGPEIAIPIAAKDEVGGDIKNEVNKVVLDYVLGVGYQLGHGPSVGVRDDGGATNVLKINTTTTLGTGKYKSSLVFLVLTYSFDG